MDIPRAMETVRIWSRGRADARRLLLQGRRVVDETHRKHLIVEIAVEIWGCKMNGYSDEDKFDLQNLLTVVQNVECGVEL